MVSIPTTQTNVNVAREFLTNALSETSALNDKSFIEVMARLEGMTKTELYQFMSEMVDQVFATSATGDDLVNLAAAYRVFRSSGDVAQLSVEIAGSIGTTIPVTSSWRGVSNEVRYYQNLSYVVGGGGTATVNISADGIGTSGNLSVGDTVEFLSASSVAGIASSGTVVSVLKLGADEELLEDLRIRLLDRLRLETGGSNMGDIRVWAQKDPNVKRAYPYTGSIPFGNSNPGERTVFIQSTKAYNPDGIADSALLASAFKYIKYKDGDDGENRIEQQCMGSIDSLLDVVSIYRTALLVSVDTIAGVDSAIIPSIKTDIETAVSELNENYVPWMDGLDGTNEKNNVLTSVSMSDVIQDVLKSYGAYAEHVNIRLPGEPYIDVYQLNPGELLDLTVEYV